MFLTRLHGERPYQVEGLLSVAGVALLCWKGRLQSQGSKYGHGEIATHPHKSPRGVRRTAKLCSLRKARASGLRLRDDALQERYDFRRGLLVRFRRGGVEQLHHRAIVAERVARAERRDRRKNSF